MNLDGIKPKDITDSLDIKRNKRSIFKAGEGAGSSGSFFFFSSDKKLLIKTLNIKERNVLIGENGILDDYI